MNFGIHITGFAKSFTIENNVCNTNGGNFAPSWYGRGIELSSAAGPDAVSGHTIRFNTCNANRNYGGTLDNGSEGVGIGLDDGVTKCSVYSNVLWNNEGNGIQVYGGGDRARWPDTGGHTITSNKMYSNCALSVMNRRSGGTAPSSFQAHISLTYVYGSPTVVSKNSFSGRTRMGVYTDGTDANVTMVGNTGAP
jgi:hypothetical protein